MLETQTTWYTPAPKVLGWHIGFWNLVGAFGFTVCGAVGFARRNEAATYASVLSTFIGSWAFLVSMPLLDLSLPYTLWIRHIDTNSCVDRLVVSFNGMRAWTSTRFAFNKTNTGERILFVRPHTLLRSHRSRFLAMMRLVHTQKNSAI